MTARALAESITAVLEADLPLLRAIPEGPATAAPNRPSGVGWSRREELGHLIDSAVNNHDRIARAALGPAFDGPGYDADAWVAVHGYVRLPWPLIVDTWAAHNGILVPLVAAIPDDRLATPCRVGGAPAVTLGALVEDYVLHMRHHLDQVLRRENVTAYPQR